MLALGTWRAGRRCFPTAATAASTTTTATATASAATATGRAAFGGLTLGLAFRSAQGLVFLALRCRREGNAPASTCGRFQLRDAHGGARPSQLYAFALKNSTRRRRRRRREGEGKVNFEWKLIGADVRIVTGQHKYVLTVQKTRRRNHQRTK